MLDMKAMRAIGGLLARQARARAVEADAQADEVISLGPLLEEWQAGTKRRSQSPMRRGWCVRVMVYHTGAHRRGTPTAGSRAGRREKRLRCGSPIMPPARSVRCPGNGPRGHMTCTKLGST